MQVVTNENIHQLHNTGRVDEYKPPEAPRAEAKEEPSAKVVESDAAKVEHQRDENGRFTKQEAKDTNTPAAKTADDDDEADADLPERARRQIGKKHRAMKEAEEFATQAYRARLAAEERAEKLQRELEARDAKSRPAQEKEDKPPKPEDFATVAEYTEALTDYKVAKRFEAEKVREAQEREQQAKAQREREFGQRVQAAAAKYSDFNEVVNGIAGTDLDRVHMDVIEYIQESEHGGDLLYTLAKDSKTLDRLRKLSPRRFIAELGKLETQFEKPSEPTTPKVDDKGSLTAAVPAQVSKAPAPIQPIEAGAAKVETDPAKMSFKELREYERSRAAKAAAR